MRSAVTAAAQLYDRRILAASIDAKTLTESRPLRPLPLILGLSLAPPQRRPPQPYGPDQHTW